MSTPPNPPKHHMSDAVKAAFVVGLLGILGTVIGAVITGGFGLAASNHSSPTATPTLQALATTSPLTQTPSPTVAASPTPFPLPPDLSAAEKTVDELCKTNEEENYQAQWNLFDAIAQQNWAYNNGLTPEQNYINGLKTQSKNNGGIANCTYTVPMRNGSNVSSTITKTYKNTCQDAVLFYLAQGPDGIWRFDHWEPPQSNCK